jgi:hypothetical protein
MRQFFSLRFWAAVVAVVGLAAGLAAVVDQGEAAPLAAPEPALPSPRRLDTIQLAVGFTDPAAFALAGGEVDGESTIVLLDGRRLLLADGTPGESTCEAVAELGGCVFAADLLGDAVVWFSLLPADAIDGGEYPLPPMVELLDGVTWARLANGWEVPLLAVVSRRCSTETTSLGDFVERIGTDHVTLFDLEAGEVSAVRCNEERAG